MLVANLQLARTRNLSRRRPFLFLQVGKALAAASGGPNPVLSAFASARLHERLCEARDCGELPRSVVRDLEALLRDFPPAEQGQ